MALIGTPKLTILIISAEIHDLIFKIKIKLAENGSRIKWIKKVIER